MSKLFSAVAQVAFSLGLGLSLAATGCGSAGDDPGTPVKESPLTGTIKGQTFSAMSAIASAGSSGKGRSLTIYDKAVTCANRFQAGSGTQILLEVDTWTDGTSFQLGGEGPSLFGVTLPLHSVTFVTQQPSGTPLNTIVSKGRVEVVKAGSGSAAGTLRVRADGGDDGSVEGQVSVTNCD